MNFKKTARFSLALAMLSVFSAPSHAAEGGFDEMGAYGAQNAQHRKFNFEEAKLVMQSGNLFRDHIQSVRGDLNVNPHAYDMQATPLVTFLERMHGKIVAIVSEQSSLWQEYSHLLGEQKDCQNVLRELIAASPDLPVTRTCDA